MVTEKRYNVPIADLVTLRVTCNKCNRSSEVAINNPPPALTKGGCSFCQQMVIPTEPGRDNALTDFLHALYRLQKLEDAVSIGFVLPAPEA